MLFIFIYLSPYLILWENTPVRIHDNLDSCVLFWKILAESGKLFANNNEKIPNMMSGLPRLSYGSEFQLILLFYILLPPFSAYVVNEFIIHIFAFLGMYILLKSHFNINHDALVNLIIIDGVSLSFAFLPFWSPGGLSIAGLPLALYAFLNIRFKKSTKKDWIILTFIPFYSSLIISYLFFITIIFLIFLKDCVIKRNFSIKFFFAILYFGSLYLLIEYRIILSTFFDKSFVSHRSEFFLYEFNFSDSFDTAVTHFLNGQIHSQSFHIFFMVYSMFIAIVSSMLLKIFKNEDLKEIQPKIWLLIKMIMSSWVISVIHGFSNWEMLSFFKKKYPILITFQWDRFYTLSPFIWYIIFAISLDIGFYYIKNFKIMQKILIRYIQKNQNISEVKIGKILYIFLLILINFQNIYNCSSNPTYIGIYNKSINGQHYISYKGYYAVEQFDEIKTDLKKPQKNYRIGCIGFDPSVALYNGFYTIDGYMINYPLEYKHRFRRLIEKELEKNPDNRQKFDDWGSKCYIFVAELGNDYISTYKWKSSIIENLTLNVEALKDLEVDFIFSSVKINNSAANNLTLFNIYNNEESIWKIFVYAVRIVNAEA